MRRSPFISGGAVTTTSAGGATKFAIHFENIVIRSEIARQKGRLRLSPGLPHRPPQQRADCSDDPEEYQQPQHLPIVSGRPLPNTLFDAPGVAPCRTLDD